VRGELLMKKFQYVGKLPAMNTILEEEEIVDKGCLLGAN